MRHYKRMKDHITKNRYIKSYIQAIIPPYAKKDIVPVGITIILILATLLPVIFYKNLPYSLRNIFASTADTTPPSPPKIILGNEQPKVIPYSHSEQNTVHLVWYPST